MKNKTGIDDKARLIELGQALASKLVRANKFLVIQNNETEKRAAELIVANKELKEKESNLKEYIEGLHTMMFMTSHRVRQPIAHILGISDIICHSINSPEELKKLANYIQESASALDIFTRELTSFMSELEQKGEKK